MFHLVVFGIFSKMLLTSNPLMKGSFFQVLLRLNPYYSWHQILAMTQLVNPLKIQANHNGSQQNCCHHKLLLSKVLFVPQPLQDFFLLCYQQYWVEFPLYYLLQPGDWLYVLRFSFHSRNWLSSLPIFNFSISISSSSPCFSHLSCSLLHDRCILCSIFPACWLSSLKTDALFSPSVPFMGQQPQVPADRSSPFQGIYSQWFGSITSEWNSGVLFLT